eukprot:5654946-Amphidinium_carterae.1
MLIAVNVEQRTRAVDRLKSSRRARTTQICHELLTQYARVTPRSMFGRASPGSCFVLDRVLLWALSKGAAIACM